jgi:hypothetical protein
MVEAFVELPIHSSRIHCFRSMVRSFRMLDNDSDDDDDWAGAERLGTKMLLRGAWEDTSAEADCMKGGYPLPLREELNVGPALLGRRPPLLGSCHKVSLGAGKVGGRRRQWAEGTVQIKGSDGDVHAIRPTGERYHVSRQSPDVMVRAAPSFNDKCGEQALTDKIKISSEQHPQAVTEKAIYGSCNITCPPANDESLAATEIIGGGDHGDDDPEANKQSAILPTLKAKHMDILDKRFLSDADGMPSVQSARTCKSAPPSGLRPSAKAVNTNRRDGSRKRLLGPKAMMPAVKGQLRMQAKTAQREADREMREARLKEHFRSCPPTRPRSQSEIRNTPSSNM